jgi:glycerate 2-kinase
MPSVLVASDSLEGPLTAAEVAAHLTAGLLPARPGLDVAALPGARTAREQLG